MNIFYNLFFSITLTLCIVKKNLAFIHLVPYHLNYLNVLSAGNP